MHGPRCRWMLLTMWHPRVGRRGLIVRVENAPFRCACWRVCWCLVCGRVRFMWEKVVEVPVLLWVSWHVILYVCFHSIVKCWKKYFLRFRQFFPYASYLVLSKLYLGKKYWGLDKKKSFIHTQKWGIKNFAQLKTYFGQLEFFFTDIQLCHHNKPIFID